MQLIGSQNISNTLVRRCVVPNRRLYEVHHYSFSPVCSCIKYISVSRFENFLQKLTAWRLGSKLAERTGGWQVFWSVESVSYTAVGILKLRLKKQIAATLGVFSASPGFLYCIDYSNKRGIVVQSTELVSLCQLQYRWWLICECVLKMYSQYHQLSLSCCGFK